MALKFHPRPGTIVICDFRGFIPPEMVKRRPVVVIAQIRGRGDLCTVVPFSTTAPRPTRPYHHKLPPETYPLAPAGQEAWAKCDMLITVSLTRLDRVRVGKRQYTTPTISPDDLMAIRRGVLHALNLPHLTPYL